MESEVYLSISFVPEEQKVRVGLRHPTTGEFLYAQMDVKQVIDFTSRLLDSCHFMLSWRKSFDARPVNPPTKK